MAKVQNVEKWGRGTAKERYGTARGSIAAKDQQYQQDPEGKHAEGYNPDSDGWVRGKGSQSPYPKFDGGKSGSK